MLISFGVRAWLEGLPTKNMYIISRLQTCQVSLGLLKMSKGQTQDKLLTIDFILFWIIFNPWITLNIIS